ncbi:dephospho-CoA kinase [Kiloniella sp. b19]|uniref:dephospho-CoA kinase n=1 Tax=Kiloniella sp. GXU_MW_B19 TaxID=3141326 RepID=UPI0031D715DB
MFVLGLTGSIAMGKSTAARFFREAGISVHDADATVHSLMASGGRAVERIAACFGKAVLDSAGAVNRKELGNRVFGNPEALEQLETILHPLVREDRERFLKQQALQRSPLVVLDVPLLYETATDRECDAVLVVQAPAFLQKQRVLSRPNMTAEKLQSILGKQMPVREKAIRAQWVVQTGLGMRKTRRDIESVIRQIRSLKPNKTVQFSK